MKKSKKSQIPNPNSRAPTAKSEVPTKENRRWDSGSGIWRLGFSGAVALIVIAAYVVFGRSGAGGAALPMPPSSVRQPAAVTAHLQDAYDAARREPESAGAVGGYCLALHADMFYAAAEQCYARAIALDDGWEWIYFRSLIRGDLGGGPDLVRDLRMVVERAATFAPAWLRLGDAEVKAGRVVEAERAWTQAAAHPEPPRSSSSVVQHVVEVPVAAHASLGLARLRLQNRDVSGAAALIEPLVGEGPGDRPLRLGGVPSGLPERLRGVPSFSSAWRLLADIERTRGRDADAARALARARRLPPYAPYADPMVDRLALESRNSTFLLRIASEANLAINGAWSEHLSRRAMQFDPDNPEVVIKLARVLRTLGKNEEALVYFRRYEELVPGDPQIPGHIGGTLSEMGRFTEAEPLLRRAAATLDDSLSHYNLALLLARTGRVDEAIGEYEQALERDAEDIRARSNLAAALVRKGDLDRALEELARVVALDPEDPVAHTNIGLVHAQRGDVMRARRALEEALRIDPAFAPAREALGSL
jgi:tetratricopeptide (TPR) repeat protein